MFFVAKTKIKHLIMPYNVVYSFVFNKEIMDCKHNFNTFYTG